MATPLILSATRRTDGTRVLIARGELDLSNIDQFIEALREATADGGTVTIDLSQVEYLDSAAINTLFAHVGHIEIVANRVLMPLLQFSGLADVVTVRPPL
ncbi:STAS domain-containing protein [Mycobacterium sp. Marseille-P9652]|uniref:STAS domain-containing protein n=1 Tax=Mycobacterium sp. Marseille-P9652 TaxID=2654950 RepID=UPI0012E8218E|nr:STAS domain-containing protein [Mycobacterium sp. Marseille-P9652]